MLSIKIKVYSNFDQKHLDKLLGSLATSTSRIYKSKIELDDEYDDRYLYIYVTNPVINRRSITDLYNLNREVEVHDSFSDYGLVETGDCPSMENLFNLRDTINSLSINDIIYNNLIDSLGNKVEMKKNILPDDSIQYSYNYINSKSNISLKDIVTLTIKGDM